MRQKSILLLYLPANFSLSFVQPLPSWSAGCCQASVFWSGLVSKFSAIHFLGSLLSTILLDWCVFSETMSALQELPIAAASVARVLAVKVASGQTEKAAMQISSADGIMGPRTHGHLGGGMKNIPSLDFGGCGRGVTVKQMTWKAFIMAAA